MKFHDLLNLPYNPINSIIDLDRISDALPSTPIEVSKQVYKDFGRSDIHQEVYGEIEIDKIKWSKVKLDACDICSCFIAPDFMQYVETVSRRVKIYKDIGWDCIDSRIEVINHWKENLTWIEAPVFIDRKLVGAENGIHLIEGHTRIGTLKGFLHNSLIENSSQHEVWFGA